MYTCAHRSGQYGRDRRREYLQKIVAGDDPGHVCVIQHTDKNDATGSGSDN